MRWYQTDRPAVATPADHPLEVRDGVAFAELCNYPLIGVHGASSLSRLLSQASGGKPPRFRAASNDVARLMISKKLGISVLPEGLISPFEAALGLRAVAIADSCAQRTLQVGVRDAEILSAAARTLFLALQPQEQI